MTDSDETVNRVRRHESEDITASISPSGRREPEPGNGDAKACYRLEQAERRLNIVENDLIELAHIQAALKLAQVETLSDMLITLANVGRDVADTQKVVKVGKRILAWEGSIISALLLSILTVLVVEYVLRIP